ncbi:MAG: T9SS type A sorting domain-containing protein [Saprospiraceae bacterium]|nr:T9SS type A sorting domain-containing protein [Saprospiraceae bacterium]
MNSMIVDGNHIYLAIRHNIAPPANIKILKLDMAGNTLAEWDLGDTQENEIPFGLLKYRDGYVIYSLLFQSPPTEISWILFTDSLFTPTHEVFFNEEEPTYGIVVTKDLFATQDGNLIATQRMGNEGGVTKLDSAGQVIWHRRLPITYGPLNLSNIHITELNDGGYAVNWFRDRLDQDTFYTYPPAIFRLDAEGNILWEQVFDTYYEDYEVKYMGNLFTATNGDIVGMGYRDFYSDELTRYLLCGWMFRLDPETGEVIWDRTLCDLSRSQRYVMAFLAGSELPNGDLVFTGAYEDTFPNGLPFINDPNVWLVRLSAEGCLVEGCNEWTIINPDGSITATDEPLAMNGGFIVYPNPGNGQVWVKAAGESGIGQRCAMALYDAQGRRMKAETFFTGGPQPFDWGDLPPGMYYYLIRSEDGETQSGKLAIIR